MTKTESFKKGNKGKGKCGMKSCGDTSMEEQLLIWHKDFQKVIDKGFATMDTPLIEVIAMHFSKIEKHEYAFEDITYILRDASLTDLKKPISYYLNKEYL